jgi:hypothetical protein
MLKRVIGLLSGSRVVSSFLTALTDDGGSETLEPVDRVGLCFGRLVDAVHYL